MQYSSDKSVENTWHRNIYVMHYLHLSLRLKALYVWDYWYQFKAFCFGLKGTVADLQRVFNSSQMC